MRILLSSLFLFTTFLLQAQKKEAQEWESIGQLKWEDYKSRPNRASSFQALTATEVSFAVSYEGDVLTIDVVNAFHPKDSWTKNDESDRLLAHERLHFDISELYARKLRQKILQTNFKSRDKKLMTEVSSLYQEKMKELARFQRKYDQETDHSIVAEAQKKWELDIQRQLKDLEQYASSRILVHLK